MIIVFYDVVFVVIVMCTLIASIETSKLPPLLHISYSRQCGTDIYQDKTVHVSWRPGDIHLSSVWIKFSGMAQPTHYSDNFICSKCYTTNDLES